MGKDIPVITLSSDEEDEESCPSHLSKYWCCRHSSPWCSKHNEPYYWCACNPNTPYAQCLDCPGIGGYSDDEDPPKRRAARRYYYKNKKKYAKLHRPNLTEPDLAPIFNIDGSKRKLMEDVLTNKRPKRSEDIVEFPLTQATVFTDFDDVRRNLALVMELILGDEEEKEDVKKDVKK